MAVNINISRNRSVQVFLYITVVSCMAAIFGFNLGGVLSSKVRLINIFMLEIYDMDSIISTFLLGALVGFFVGGRLANTSGRILPILGSFALGVIGQCSSTLAPTFSTLFIAEFSVGTCFGIYFVCAVCYISEISMRKSRGKSGALISVFLCLGLLCAALLKDVLPYNSIASVVTMLGFSVPLLIIGYLRLPESPRYLALSSSSDEALSVLVRLRYSTSEAARELAAINECVLGEDKGITLFFRSIVYRRQLWFLMFLTFLANCSGCIIGPYMSMDMLNAFFVSVGQLHPNARYDMISTLLYATLSAAFAGSYMGFILADSVGRRKVLMFSIIFNQAMLFATYICMLSAADHILDHTAASVLVSVFMTGFVFSSVLAMSVMMTVLYTEFLPIKGREFGFTVIMIANVILMMIGMYFFTKIGRLFGPMAVYAFFMFSGILFFAVVYRVLPETRHHLLETMENTIFNNRSIGALKELKS